MLVATTESGRRVGTIRLVGGKLVSDNPGLESMFPGALRRNDDDAKKAYAELGKFSNGYLTISEQQGPNLVSDQLGDDDDNEATAGSQPREGRKDR